MPPKAAASTPRGRGRPARVSVVETVAAVAVTPKNRGRPSKATADAAANAVQVALKRGRRSLAATEAVVESVADVSAPAKRSGRPRKSDVVAEQVAVPAKRAGRPRKADVIAPDAETPKRRGRPPKNALASVPAVRAVKVTPRINPKMRSRLRARNAPEVAKKEEVIQPVKRRRGPNKAVAAPAPKKTAGHKALNAGIAKTAPKVVAPRKRRGYTSLEVPDKFVSLVKQMIQDQLDGTVDAAAELETSEVESEAAEIDEAGEADEEGAGESSGSDELQNTGALIDNIEMDGGNDPLDLDMEAEFDTNADTEMGSELPANSQDEGSEEVFDDARGATVEDLSPPASEQDRDLGHEYEHEGDFTDEMAMDTAGASANRAVETMTEVETVTSTVVQDVEVNDAASFSSEVELSVHEVTQTQTQTQTQVDEMRAGASIGGVMW